MLAICFLALVKTTNTAEARPRNPSPLRTDGKIAFIGQSDPNFEIYVIDVDGSGITKLTKFPPEVGGGEPFWSPDGKRIGFGRAYSGKISVMDADGSNLRDLHLDLNRSDIHHTWSPDGTKLAFSGGTPPDYVHDIYTIEPDGSNLINLTKTPELDEMHPDFSPDGSQICYSSHSSGRSKHVHGIFLMNADGSQPTLLTERLGGETIPGGCDWSPEGTKIAFSGAYDVYVINVDGSGQTNLTRSNSKSNYDPEWSPDGVRIVFARETEGYSDIYTMNPDGSDVDRLTTKPGEDFAPTWQPLPRTTPPKDADGPDVAQGTKKPGVEDVDRDRPERTVIVKPGDSLWSISEERLGQEASSQRVYDYTFQMYALNRKIIGSDPDLIFAGQRLSLPPLGEG
jgi:Tol biopolymer transport system component